MRAGWRGVLGVACVACLACLAACKPQEKTGVVVGPGLTAVPAVPAASAPAVSRRAPIAARFVELATGDAHIDVKTCEQVVVAIAEGRGLVFGSEGLQPGDLLLVEGEGGPSPEGFELHGTGSAIVANVDKGRCEPGSSNKLTHRIIRGAAAPELSWSVGAGAMHAHLDFEEGPAYVGRLEGTAPVAEHTHPGTWEVLCAIEAAGTFTLDGKEQRLARHTVVVVPPDAKHAWRPDPGSRLVAVQLYDPPGPQQRFRKLAAEPR